MTDLPPPTPNAIPVGHTTRSSPRAKFLNNQLYRRYTKGLLTREGDVVLYDWWIPADEWPDPSD